MSKISLAPDANGTGIFTIASPNSNTNRTLTLPDDTGTIVTNSGNQAGSFTTLNTSGQVVFNDAGADVDFRVEGDTDANLLFVDASADEVGIGTTSTEQKFTVVGSNLPTSGMPGNITVYTSDSQGANIGGSIALGGYYLDATARIPFAAIHGKKENSTNNNSHGYMAFVVHSASTGATERLRIDSSGNLLVGQSSSNFDATTLVGNGVGISGNFSNTNGQVIRSTNTTGTQYFVGFIRGTSSCGSITSTTTNSTTYATSSDYRLKENVAPMTGALAKVSELNPVTYTWKADGSAGEGFIAHELQAVVPECVVGEKDAVETRQVEVSPAVPATYDEEGNELTPAVEAVYEEREVPVYQGVDTSFLVATLTAAIQELSAKNDALEARIAALETGA